MSSPGKASDSSGTIEKWKAYKDSWRWIARRIEQKSAREGGPWEASENNGVESAQTIVCSARGHAHPLSYSWVPSAKLVHLQV